MRGVIGLLLALACTLALAAPARAGGPAPAAKPPKAPVCGLAPLPRSAPLTQIHRLLGHAATTPVRLLALGSSTTYGADLADLHDRWPDRLMRDLAARGIAADPTTLSQTDPDLLGSGGGAEMVVGAVPGATAETSLAEYAPGLALSLLHPPRIDFEMIGANDYWAGVPPTVYGAALRATIAGLDVSATPPIVVLVSDYRDPAAPLNGSTPAYPWSAYVAQQRAVAAADPAHRLFVNLTPWFTRAGVPGKDPYGVLDTGGVHPSVRGHAVIARLVLRALRYGC